MRLVVGLCALAIIGCGDDARPAGEAASTTQGRTTTTKPPAAPPPKGEPTKPAETPPGDPRENALERAAAQAVRGYLEAIDLRDGDTLCALLDPNALDLIELPEQRGDCASSLEASIGYRDPRGLPVWERSRVISVRAPELAPDGQSARVIATVVTTFADREQPSVEDDVVYVQRSGDRWLIAKPSSTLYRAVGISDIPLTVLSPPSG